MATQFRQVLETQENGDTTVVRFCDPVIMDEKVITAIGEQLFRLVEELGKHKLRLDFLGVEYLASHALGKLVSLQRKIQAVNGQLVFCNLDPEIQKVLEVSRLDKYFTVE
jgi:anti-sigma B factor antagonist